MENVSIDYEAVFSAVKEGILYAKNTLLAGELDGYEVSAWQERQFVPQAEYRPNCIYLIVSFGTASMNFMQSSVPVTITCISEQNGFDKARALLSAFASHYNLRKKEGTIQAWNSPTVSTRFNDVGNGYVASLMLTGTFVVSAPDMDGIAKLECMAEGGEYEEIPFVAYRDSFQNQLAPQPFPNGGGFVSSVARYSAFTITFSTYPMTGLSFFKRLRETKFDATLNDAAFSFRFTFRDGTRKEAGNMRLVSMTSAQNLATNQSMEVSFSK